MNDVTKDILQDLIDHTYSLSDLNLIKVTGTQTETLVNAAPENRTVILNGKFKNPILSFEGVFGMPNLPKLKTILGFSDEYDENSKITIQTTNVNGTVQPTTIHFENKLGDFVNDYRLMSKVLVEEQIKQIKFKGATWNVDFVPVVPGIQRLKKQFSVHNEETTFTTKFANGNILVNLGDPSTTTGNFTFVSGVTGNMTKQQHWPIKQFLSIMDLVGDKHIYISDQGVMRITVDSGIADYEYFLPAQTK